ncbi:hypothetical protein B0I35DRAFT_95982 [Stachybotrys elegans]|uniref:Zn(2)-C6 fungal-type domain-containing protein n=1 Tax=Stachybotrys elegans TaxID=80388 RepID=A0A8K0SFC5_9HYPO|nr:hypothetical protein B0I35DRAFT_95982 [Stachybotrys elegans]
MQKLQKTKDQGSSEPRIPDAERLTPQQCDGARPQCAPCRKGLVDCMFETPPGLSPHRTPRTQLAKYHAVIKLLHEGTLAESMQVLQTVRDSINVEHAVDSVLALGLEQRSRTSAEVFEDAALEAFRSLQQARSPEATLRSIGDDMSGYATPLLYATNWSLLPPTQIPLEFQLGVEPANVYPSLVPLDLASLDLQGIGPLGIKASLRSHVHEPIRNLISTVDPPAITGESTDSRVIDLVDARLSHVNDFEGLEGDMGKETEDATKPRGWKGDATSMFLTLTSDNNDMV